MKEISEIEKKELPVESKLIQLAAWIRQRYGTTMNEALKTVLPIRRQIKSVEEHWLNFALPEDEMKKELNCCLLKHYKAKARLLQGMFAEGGQMTSKLAAKKLVKEKVEKMGITDLQFSNWNYAVCKSFEGDNSSGDFGNDIINRLSFFIYCPPLYFLHS